MNVAEQKTSLRRYGFDSNDPLLTWLNAGYHFIETYFEWPWLQLINVFTAPAGAQALSAPADLFKVISIRDMVLNNKLTYFETTRFEREIEDQSQTGPPDIYVVTGSVITLWPIPDADVTVKLVYERQLVDLVGDTDVPQIPERLHYPMVQYAASIALQAENEEQRAQTAFNEAIGAIDRTKARFTRPTSDQPNTVVDTQGYGVC